MTKLVTVRVVVATDDAVDLQEVKARLKALITAKGVEILTETDGESRIHWSTADVLQGPDKKSAGRAAPKPASQRESQ